MVIPTAIPFSTISCTTYTMMSYTHVHCPMRTYHRMQVEHEQAFDFMQQVRSLFLMFFPDRNVTLNVNLILLGYRVIAFKVQEWITVPITRVLPKSSSCILQFSSKQMSQMATTHILWLCAILSRAEGHSYILKLLFHFTHSRITSENVYDILGWLLQIFTVKGRVKFKNCIMETT